MVRVLLRRLASSNIGHVRRRNSNFWHSPPLGGSHYQALFQTASYALNVGSAVLQTMTRAHIILFLIAISCSNQKDDSSSFNSVIDLKDLSIDQKAALFKSFQDSLDGDYTVYDYSGKEVQLQLVLDTDRRFVLRQRSTPRDTVIMTDGGSIREFSLDTAFHNLCFGSWSESSGDIKLNVFVGGTAFFDSVKNPNSIRILDSNTVVLVKGTKQIWITGVPCSKR
ncbi:MAG: hypothetical protein JST14_11095 [Bacteroidetes bacterium]|nr:hypothetical protein [Bacteroidota bacterium]